MYLRAQHSSLVAKVLPCIRQDPIWALVRVPTSHPAPCLWPGKQSRMAQGLGTLHPRGRPRGSSWLGIGAASTIVAPWGGNQQMEDLFCVSASQYI